MTKNAVMKCKLIINRCLIFLMTSSANPLATVDVEAYVFYDSYVIVVYEGSSSKSCQSSGNEDLKPVFCLSALQSVNSSACLWYSLYNGLGVLGKGHRVLNNSIN